LSQDSNKGLFTPVTDTVGKNLLTPFPGLGFVYFLYMNSLSSRKVFL